MALQDSDSSGNNCVLIGKTITGAAGQFPTIRYVIESEVGIHREHVHGRVIDNASLGRVGGNAPIVPIDVRNKVSTEGNFTYHDGNGSKTEGPASEIGG